MEEFIQFLAEQWVLFGAFLFITFLLVRNFLTASMSGVKHIDVNTAIRMMNDGAIVVDVRLENEFAKGHIKDSRLIPVGALESRIKELEKEKSGDIIVSCQTGNRSLRAAQILKKHGYESVYNLSGGMSAWQNANMPIESGTQKRKRKEKNKEKAA
jgi:rhodanese-related sulfurtransferase